MGIKKKIKTLVQLFQKGRTEDAQLLSTVAQSVTEVQEQLTTVRTAMDNELHDSIERLSGLQESFMTQQAENIESLGKTVRELTSGLRKHDMSLEDLLETIEQASAKDQTLNEALHEEKARSASLVSLLMAYHDAMFSLRSVLQKNDETWAEQFRLIDGQLQGQLAKSGLEILSGTGVSVDYDLHEVMSVRETGDKQKNATIAEVYTCGYVYLGKVLRKAQIVAYRYVEGYRDPSEEVSEDMLDEAEDLLCENSGSTVLSFAPDAEIPVLPKQDPDGEDRAQTGL